MTESVQYIYCTESVNISILWAINTTLNQLFSRLQRDGPEGVLKRSQALRLLAAARATLVL